MYRSNDETPQGETPNFIRPNLDGIPDELKKYKRWVTWTYEDRSGKPTKVPYGTGGKWAKSNDATTWKTFDEAVWDYQTGGRAGVGFMLGEEVLDGGEIITFGGLDLDKCISDDTISDEAKYILGEFDTYAEVSPSGTGVKAIFKGAIPGGRRQGWVEVYSHGRFFTLTGHRVGTAERVLDCQDSADWLTNEYMDPPEHSGDGTKYVLDLGVIPDEVVKKRAGYARSWLAEQPGAVQGQGNGADGYCLKLAAKVKYGFAVPDDVAVNLMYEWGQRPDHLDKNGNPWPWTRKEMERKVKAAKCDQAPGWMLDKYGHAEAEAEVMELFAKKGIKDDNVTVDSTHAGDEPFDPEKYKPKKPVLLRWHDLKEIAARQEDKWLVRSVVEPGTLTVFSGLPYSGKTTVLSHLMGCLGSGRDWFGYETVKPCPMLFINCDRLRERIIVRRIQRGLPDEIAEGMFAERFYTVPVEDIPLTLTPQYISGLIDIIRSSIEIQGEDTGLVIIDPLRAAFLQEVENGGENDPTTMTKVLSPLRKLTRQTNWAVILPHHNNRGRDQYAGSAAIAGNTDAMWNISRDEGSTNSTLSITTRDGMLDPLDITEGPEGLRVVHTADPFWSKWPDTPEKAVTPFEIQNITGVSKATYYRNIKGANDRMKTLDDGRVYRTK
jgi:hypothetical protein